MVDSDPLVLAVAALGDLVQVSAAVVREALVVAVAQAFVNLDRGHRGHLVETASMVAVVAGNLAELEEGYLAEMMVGFGLEKLDHRQVQVET